MRIEPETARRSRVGVPIIFGHNEIAARGNDGRSGNAEFLRHSALVGQIPVADVHGRRVGVIKLDGIKLRRVGVGEGLVDPDRAE